MFYRVKEASAPVICGSVHPHEASWSLSLSPHLDIRGSELCAVLATSLGWQLLSGRLIESQRSTTAKGCMPEASASQPCTAGTRPIIIITQVLGLEPR